MIGQKRASGKFEGTLWGRTASLFDWPRTGDEDIHESPGALLPVRTGCHVGDADQCPEQIEWLEISAYLAVLNRALTGAPIAP
jgi:hypothetical protein